LTQPATAQRFGAYEILYELKAGGMGAVLLGRRRGPGAFEQLVAIKTIRPEHAGSAAVRAMFLDEAAILARLNHPGIAHVHDFGEQGGTLYMVMEYVAGMPFREVAEQAPPPLVVARAIAEACRGLHAAHEARDLAGTELGLVHRDISPDNLMLGYDGRVKVIDFGIALVKNRQAPVTEFGMLKGKPPYMSPEQIKNEVMDRRSDVFSLGVMLWELLARQQLFDGDSIYAIALAVEQKAIPPPSRVIDAPLPAGLDAVVMGALERDLARRTATAAALAEQLEQVVQAAGGETLEAWADRELAAPRDKHRAWLAQVVGGTALPRAVGRATGLLTEVAAEPGLAKTDPALEDAIEAPPRRRSIALPVIAVLALVTAGFAVYFALPRAPAPAPAVAVVVPDSSTRTSSSTSPSTDAGVLPDAPAPPARDAGVHRVVHVPRDAHVAMAVPIDAAVVTGIAHLYAKHRDHFLNVIIDGTAAGTTPILPRGGRAIPAGPHHFQLVEPTDGTVVVDRRVVLHDGETFTLEP
jgi:serine/threonine-protein kinase